MPHPLCVLVGWRYSYARDDLWALHSRQAAAVTGTGSGSNTPGMHGAVTLCCISFVHIHLLRPCLVAPVPIVVPEVMAVWLVCLSCGADKLVMLCA